MYQLGHLLEHDGIVLLCSDKAVYVYYNTLLSTLKAKLTIFSGNKQV